MNRSTLNELIRSVIPDAEGAELEIPDSVETVPGSSTTLAAPPADEVEKIASTLEFIGRKGVENLLPKVASAPETNAGKQPGGKGELDLGKTGKGTHHPSLASNQAAIDYTQREKSKHEAPALSMALDAKPFADPVLKQKLTNAASKGDPNIKSAEVHDKEKVRAEIARRLAAGETPVTPANTEGGA